MRTLRTIAGTTTTLAAAAALAVIPSAANAATRTPDTPCLAERGACVDLGAHRAWLINETKGYYGPVNITSGKPGYETPTGTYQVYWKDIDHKSSIYHNAPMPYSVFFNGGIAFHEGSLAIQSAGCIHLSHDVAVKFYGSLNVGDTVQVVN
ncbi:MAG TPA: L,D-transpeptidase family protein [Mycobacteriales bacterium]|nr:L,D-transpeptidase family protein [Mycobacteriales bacterium]